MRRKSEIPLPPLRWVELRVASHPSNLRGTGKDRRWPYQARGTTRCVITRHLFCCMLVKAPPLQWYRCTSLLVVHVTSCMSAATTRYAADPALEYARALPGTLSAWSSAFA